MKWAHEAVMITDPRQVARMSLPRKHRFVFVMADTSPQISPVSDPGDYEIDIAAMLPGARLPVLILTVPKRDAVAFSKASAETSNDMIVQAENTVRSTQH